jgi:signal transduction histidine kinase
VRADVRRFFGTPSSDIALALVALAVTQVVLLRSADDWAWARMAFPLAVALAPALIALAGTAPVWAAAWLVAGAFLSMALGRMSWVLLAGCCLALVRLPRRVPALTAVLTVGAVAATPILLNAVRREVMTLIYPSVYYQIAGADGTIETGRGLQQDRFDRIWAGSWPLWQSLLLVAVGAAAIAWTWFVRKEPRPRTTTGVESVAPFLGNPRHQWGLDALFAVAVSSLLLIDLWRDQVADGNWWSAPGWMPWVIAYSALVLVLRRRWPVLPVVVLAVSALVTYWQSPDSWAVLTVLALALYSLAAGRTKVRWVLVSAVAVLAALPLIAWRIRYAQMSLIFPRLKNEPVIFDFDGVLRNFTYDGLVNNKWPVSLSLLLLLPLSLGFLARLYRRNREASQREAALERAAAEQDAAQVVLTERSHIARDLHDVVAHAVNLMVIQAETGPDLIARGDKDVLAGFQRIGDAGRRALGELDRMLSALRDAEGVPDPELTPQPGLSDLQRLVKDVAHDGLTVELDVQGATELAPTGHQLAAYRLVQEALTNVVRHAEATKVAVTLEIQAEELSVEVSDNGHGFDPEVARTGGRHGLAGMRERVRIHHGTLTIDSAPGRGTTVVARIPLAAEVSR